MPHSLRGCPDFNSGPRDEICRRVPRRCVSCFTPGQFILRGHRVGVKANSGHELGHLGLDDFMAHRPGWERPISEGGATWVHFGANLGAATGELYLQSVSDDLRTLAETELGRAGQTPDVVAP